jgi:hypothetical protein
MNRHVSPTVHSSYPGRQPFGAQIAYPDKLLGAAMRKRLADDQRFSQDAAVVSQASCVRMPLAARLEHAGRKDLL